MTNPTPAKTTAKTAGLSTLLIGLTQLPAPYSHWAGDALMFVGILGIIGTQIPAPKEGSKWMSAYKVLSYLAANWGQAVNAGMVARGSGTHHPFSSKQSTHEDAVMALRHAPYPYAP